MLIGKLLDFDHTNSILKDEYEKYNTINIFVVSVFIFIYLSGIIEKLFGIQEINHQDTIVIILGILILADIVFFKQTVFKNDIHKHVYNFGIHVLTDKSWYLHNTKVMSKKHTKYATNGNIIAIKKAFKINADNTVSFIGVYSLEINETESKFLYDVIKRKFNSDPNFIEMERDKSSKLF